MTKDTSMLDDSQQLKIKPGYRLQWETVQQSWVMLFPEGMIQLNDSAAMILKQFQQPNRIDAAIDTLADRFPGEKVRDDIIEFLEEACDQQWLEVTE